MLGSMGNSMLVFDMTVTWQYTGMCMLQLLLFRCESRLDVLPPFPDTNFLHNRQMMTFSLPRLPWTQSWFHTPRFQNKAIANASTSFASWCRTSRTSTHSHLSIFITEFTWSELLRMCIWTWWFSTCMLYTGTESLLVQHWISNRLYWFKSNTANH